MDRRKFLVGSLGMATMAALSLSSRVARATPKAAKSATGLPTLSVTLNDTGFTVEQPLAAGRYEVIVSNDGTLAESHFALGKIPDGITDAQYQEWLDSDEGETDALRFEDIAFVGVPDWPPPGGKVTGVIDLAPGRYFLFDPITDRAAQTLSVEGELAPTAEPVADLTVTLREMEIVLPDSAFTTEPMRWKIENVGAMSHEVAIVPVTPDFTAGHLQRLFALPYDATPPPDMPAFVYQPVAAIGILAGQHTSWLDVRLGPGRYLAACMLPFSIGYPHAMDGMYRFFDIA
jgi:hypothetical protein